MFEVECANSATIVSAKNSGAPQELVSKALYLYAIRVPIKVKITPPLSQHVYSQWARLPNGDG